MSCFHKIITNIKNLFVRNKEEGLYYNNSDFFRATYNTKYNSRY